ncbi:hypothetical protein KUV85_16600 [Nocardioides panacisoli]|uniref:O-antigen ligase family protein n=1 Tax=Nocardioides panacisoli TaxID=627624 RepID=UPI001C636692|nr:hypothetical protein [Nocardioides panacisoli]QYJ03920.1 hypothetical protein KUV85_16600 [Nocardioides panacisoli]
MVRLSGREVLLASVAVLVTAALVAVATQGLLYGAGALAAAAVLVLLLVRGAETVAIGFLMGAFATAPMYRGIEHLSGGVATPTDVLLIPGIALLLPTLLQRRLRVPTTYVVAVGLVGCWGLIGSVAGGEPVLSIFQLVQWLFFLGGLPLVIAWWRPDRSIVVRLLWSYLAGHMLSVAYALYEGRISNGRFNGLTHHENAFGLAGVAAIAIVLFLLHEHRDLRVRGVLLAIGAASALSISMSGSRAALLVAIVLVLMVPVVEKSAVWGFFVAAAVGLAIAALPLIVGSSGDDSAISRLAGDGTSAVADSRRSTVLDYGLERFAESPLFGSGLVNVEVIHNGFVAVVVAIGLFGAPAYLVALYVLARPLFLDHPLRRLGYLVWAFIGSTAALPSLYDRTLWVPISLAILPALGQFRGGRDPDADAVRPEVDESRQDATPAQP